MSKGVTKLVRDQIWPLVQWVGWTGLAVAGLVAAVELGVDADKADELLAAFGVALLSALMIVVGPGAARRTFDRISKFNLGAVGLELRDIPSGPAQEDADDGGGGEPEDLTDLRLKLEAKMAYVAKIMLAPEPATGGAAGIPAYLTIGSLETDGYLTRDQGRRANEVLTLRPESLAAVDPAKRRGYLEDAERLVASFRAIVFRSMVRKELEEKGWQVTQLHDDDDKRRDLEVRSGPPPGPKHRVIPVFAINSGSTLINKPKERLEKLRDKDTRNESTRVIVVPDNSNMADDAGSDPALVHLGGLHAHLEPPPQGEDGGT